MGRGHRRPERLAVTLPPEALAVPGGLKDGGVVGERGHWGRPMSSGKRAVQRFHPLWACRLVSAWGPMASPWACFFMPVGTLWSPLQGPGGACDERTWGVHTDTPRRAGALPQRQLGCPQRGNVGTLTSHIRGQGREWVDNVGKERRRRCSPWPSALRVRG